MVSYNECFIQLVHFCFLFLHKDPSTCTLLHCVVVVVVAAEPCKLIVAII